MLQSGHLQRGGTGYDPVKAYHDSREKGTGMFAPKPEAKSQAKSDNQHAADKTKGTWNRAEDEGRDLVESARARGREGVQQTKEAWRDVKNSFKSAGGWTGQSCTVCIGFGICCLDTSFNILGTALVHPQASSLRVDDLLAQQLR